MVLNRPLSEFGHLNTLLENTYGLKNIHWGEDLGGFSSRNIELSAGDLQWVLKDFGLWSEQKIHAIEKLLHFLALSGIPCILPRRTLHGEYHFLSGSARFALFPKICNCPLSGKNFTQPTLSSIAKVIAHLHSLSPKLPKQIHLPSVPPSSVELFEMKSSSLLKLTSGSLHNSRIKKLIKRSILIKRDYLAKAHLQKDFAEIAQGSDLLHGDLHSANMLFDAKGDLIYLLDFEHSRVGHRAFDLARFIQTSCLNSGYLTENFRCCRFFMRKYALHRALTKCQLLSGLRYEAYFTATSLFFESNLIGQPDDAPLADDQLIVCLERDLRKLSICRDDSVELINSIMD